MTQDLDSMPKYLNPHCEIFERCYGEDPLFGGSFILYGRDGFIGISLERDLRRDRVTIGKVSGICLSDLEAGLEEVKKLPGSLPSSDSLLDKLQRRGYVVQPYAFSRIPGTGFQCLARESFREFLLYANTVGSLAPNQVDLVHEGEVEFGLDVFLLEKGIEAMLNLAYLVRHEIFIAGTEGRDSRLSHYWKSMDDPEHTLKGEALDREVLAPGYSRALEIIGADSINKLLDGRRVSRTIRIY